MKLLPIWKVISGLQLNINENKLSATDHVKLLGIEVDNKLKFNKHIKTLCSKVNKKISAFSRLNTYISREQALTICNAVILSNFNYKRLAAYTNVLFGSSIKNTNVPSKHCSRATC